MFYLDALAAIVCAASAAAFATTLTAILFSAYGGD